MSNTNVDSIVEVSRADLPLHCPMPNAALWDSHPKVFIPVEESGDAKCPYCGTRYHFNDAQVNDEQGDKSKA